MDSETADSAVQRAVDLAAEARDRAYTPYSKFPMGAAVIGVDGREVTGTLVENVSLGLAMCAERAALFAAVEARVSPAVLAVCAERTDGELTFPCGACRQVALELAGPELVVVAVDPDGQQGRSSLADLLPRAPHRFTFDPAN